MPHILVFTSLIAVLILVIKLNKKNKSILNIGFNTDSSIVLIKTRVTVIVGFFIYLFTDIYQTQIQNSDTNTWWINTLKIIIAVGLLTYTFSKKVNYKFLDITIRIVYLFLVAYEMQRLYASNFLPYMSIEFVLLILFSMVVFTKLYSYILFSVILLIMSFYIVSISTVLLLHKVLYLSCAFQVLVIVLIYHLVEKKKLQNILFSNKILESTAMLIAIFDKNGNNVFLNSNLEKILMMDSQIFQNDTFWDNGYFNKVDNLAFKKIVLDTYKSKKEQSVFNTLILQNNNLEKIKWNLSAVENDFVLAIGENKTKEINHFVELELLSLVAKKTTNLIVITDSNGYIEWVNEEFEKITKYKFSEVVGKKPGRFLQGPNTSKESIAIIAQNLKNRQSIKIDILNYAKDGEEYWLELSIDPVFNEVNKLVKFIAIEKIINKN